MNSLNTQMNIKCPVCDYTNERLESSDLGEVKGNTERFRNTSFPLWKCPKCSTIVSLTRVDLQDIYNDYPLNSRKLDVFAKGTLNNLLSRLQKAGMKRSDSIVDFGCGNGIFVTYLKGKGYKNVVGYDPYVPRFSKMPADLNSFDVVVNNDTLEHCEDMPMMMKESLALLKPGGLLYVGTADSDPVDMDNLEIDIMRLHQPFHRIIITEDSLHTLVNKYHVTPICSYTRSYHDTLRPFSNYRFLDELNKKVGHNLDLAMDDKVTTSIFLRTPRLWFFAFFGYWFPSAIEPAVIVRKIS